MGSLDPMRRMNPLGNWHSTNAYCKMYADWTMYMMEPSGSHRDAFTVRGLGLHHRRPEAPVCDGIIRNGTNVGGALVGSDDKVAVTFEVTAPTFKPGNVNYICMVDGEGRMSNTDVEDFNLEPSIKVVPRVRPTGDTVNVFAQDYPTSGRRLQTLLLAGRQDIRHRNSRQSSVIANDGSGDGDLQGSRRAGRRAAHRRQVGRMPTTK